MEATGKILRTTSLFCSRIKRRWQLPKSFVGELQPRARQANNGLVCKTGCGAVVILACCRSSSHLPSPSRDLTTTINTNNPHHTTAHHTQTRTCSGASVQYRFLYTSSPLQLNNFDALASTVAPPNSTLPARCQHVPSQSSPLVPCRCHMLTNAPSVATSCALKATRYNTIPPSVLSRTSQPLGQPS